MTFLRIKVPQYRRGGTFISGRAGSYVSPSAANVAEEGAQGTTILTFTRVAKGTVSGVSISNVTPANAVQLNANGLTLEYGSARINLEAPTTEVTFNYNFTDENGAKVIPVRLTVTDIADAPTVTGAAATADAAFAGLQTGTQKAVDLRTLFGTSNAAPLTYAASVGTIAGDGYSWTYTPTYADWEVYGDPANFRITITATDANGQTGVAETVQGITLINTAPAGADSTGTFVSLAGSAPVIAPASSIPADGATGVNQNGNVVVAYDRPIKFGSSGTVTLRNVTDNSTIQTFNVATDQGTTAGKVSISGNNLTIRPTSALPTPSKNVSVQISAGAVTNLGGINCAAVTNDTTLDFTTGSGNTAPAQFGTGDWSLADPKLSDGTINVVITALPNNGGSAITALQYQLDGGAWTSLGGTTTGTYAITGTYNTLATIGIRAVNAVGNGTGSNTKTITPKGVKYLGEVVNGNSASNTTFTIDFTSLGLQAGDVVFIFDTAASNAQRTTGASGVAYTNVASQAYANDLHDSTSILQYQVMPATPDANVTIQASGASTTPKRAVARAYRGVDTTTIFDVTTPAAATAINGLLAVPPAITPVTVNALIACFGAGARLQGDTTTYTSSDLADFTSSIQESAGNKTTVVGVGHKRWASGTFTPAAFGTATTTVDDSYTAWTIALKPA